MPKAWNKYLESYNPSTMQRTAFLSNAYNKEEVSILNGVGSLKFRMPLGDAKNDYLTPFSFIKSFTGQYYRIIEIVETIDDGGSQSLSYTCEHCIAVLCDSMLPGWHQRDGLATDSNIRHVLAGQKVSHWRLGRCDFSYNFSYGWQDENCLNALFSISEVFTDAYQWAFDMTLYPWSINLIRLTGGNPAYYLSLGRNNRLGYLWAVHYRFLS